ncbi:MAG: polyhydroxyalkanoate depolymerase [Novosphingobium sp.]|nr:polyhydroxyalkanoate depolymerase [Novosphingobium sp.]
MIYLAYETLCRSTRPLAWLLDQGHQLARDDRNPLKDTLPMRAMATACELPARSLKDYGKPTFEVWEELGDQDVVIDGHVVASLPFADLLNFTEDDGAERPKVLIAAALSGHHATLLQDTVSTFTQDFDTYITDWKDARTVPPEAGEFGFDDYVEYLIEFMEELGPGTHMVATCQAAPPAMVAAAVMTERKSDCVPASMTLRGGPVDTRIGGGLLGKATEYLPFALFEKLNVQTVPPGHPGSGRKVYPGFFQLSGFISLNPKPHFKQYWNFIRNSLKGDDEALQKFRDFYDEYFAVLDMSDKFYLETLRKVFFEHHIPTGQMEFRGKLVDFAAVDGLRLLSVEGANDNFCPPGQTMAAHAVFSGVPEEDHKNYIQNGVGHYGVFSGSKFRSGIYPVIRDFVWETDGIGDDQKAPHHTVVSGESDLPEEVAEEVGLV